MNSQIEDKKKFRDLTILVVDDSKTSATLIRQQINALGTPHDNVDICSSYQEAIKHVGQRFYDVLILDYHLEQCINGNELASLLSKKKLLSRQTGIILISGDSRQETVLTVLSGKVQHFIKKPIQTHALGVKILSVREDQQAIAHGQGLIADAELDQLNKVDELGLIIDSSPSPILVESNLLETIEDEKQWDLLSLMLQRSMTPMHMAKVSALASEYYHQGLTRQAIQILEEHLASNPLAHKVMDKLVSIYVQMDMPFEAINIAIRAFECTPSIHDRMLTAAKLSAQVNNTSALISIGKTFSNHVSIVDVSWISAVIRYSDCVLAQLNKQPSSMDRKQLVQCINQFFKVVKKRLTSSQRPFLTCFIHLFSARLQILQNKQNEAHQSLFKAVSPHYTSFDKMPTVLLVYIVPLADEFGEIWLSESLLSIAKTRNLFEQQTREDLSYLTTAPHRTSQISSLQQKFESARDAINSHDRRACTYYYELLEHYPLCTEAQLGMLKANTIFNNQSRQYGEQLTLLISNGLLPVNWRQWLEEIERVGIARPLPAAL